MPRQMLCLRSAFGKDQAVRIDVAPLRFLAQILFRQWAGLQQPQHAALDLPSSRIQMSNSAAENL